MSDDEARWNKPNQRMVDPDVPDRPDGFRKPIRRGKGWLQKAIADGSVRAPGAPDPDEGKTYTGTVIQPPVATASQEG